MSATVRPVAAVGARFAPGAYTIQRHEDVLLRDLLDAPAGDGPVAHPLWGMLAALRGLGDDVDGILAVAGARVDEGPVIASCELEYERPLEVGVPYAVTGHVTGLERKHGRRTGPFDLYTFVIELATADGRPASRLTQVWVLPREGAGGD